MATWHVSGLLTDHTQSVQVSIRNFIKSNWSLTGDLGVGRVFFGTGWWDANRGIQMHFRHDVPPTASRYTMGANGLQLWNDSVTIHYFVSTNQKNEEPPALDRMYNETVRIVMSDTGGLEASQGFCSMWFIRPPYTLPQPSSQNSTWHGVATLAVKYYKVFS